MKTKEFKARIKNGVIRIPKKYSEFENAEVKITLVDENDNLDKEKRKKERIELMKKIQEVNPFKKIEDPVKWQRELRNDWK